MGVADANAHTAWDALVEHVCPIRVGELMESGAKDGDGKPKKRFPNYFMIYDPFASFAIGDLEGGKQRFIAVDPYWTVREDEELLAGNSLLRNCVIKTAGRPQEVVEAPPELWALGFRAWQCVVAVGGEMRVPELCRAIAGLDEYLTKLWACATRTCNPETESSLEEALDAELELAQKASALYELLRPYLAEDEPTHAEWPPILGAAALVAIDAAMMCAALGDTEACVGWTARATQLVTWAEEPTRLQEARDAAFTTRQAKAGRSRHAATERLKQEIIARWSRGEFKNKAHAARWARRHFGIKGRDTVPDWIREHERGAQAQIK